MVRTSVFKDNGIEFPKGINYGEDLFFIVSTLQFCYKISLIEKPLYHYFIYSSSTSHTMSKTNVYQVADLYNRLQLIVRDAEILKIIKGKQACSVLWMAWNCPEISSREFKQISKPYRCMLFNKNNLSVMRKVILILASYGPTSLLKHFYSKYRELS